MINKRNQKIESEREKAKDISTNGLSGFEEALIGDPKPDVIETIYFSSRRPIKIPKNKIKLPHLSSYTVN